MISKWLPVFASYASKILCLCDLIFFRQIGMLIEVFGTVTFATETENTIWTQGQ